MKIRLLLASLLAFFFLFLSILGLQTSWAQAARPIVADGKTQTTVTTNGNITAVTTGTVRGQNGFNSFSAFNVGQGSTVNLFLPSNATNLLNLVNGGVANISGILNSLKDGKIGGHVFFIDPYGMVVGTTGVINVGALTVISPTKNFMTGFFDANGNPLDAPMAAVLSGNVPLSSDGLISVHGRINAIGDIKLAAGDVVNAGMIGTGAVFVAKSPDFTDAVNVKGMQTGSQLAVTNGNIEIVALHDVENSGTISAQGVSGVNGGSVNIHAGNDVRLIGNSVISTSGAGSNSNAGNIKILADGNAYLNDSAQVAASGGDISGDAGSIEFSAKGTLALNGGTLIAGATNGARGQILLDPTDLVVNTNQNSAGADITMAADNSITVGCATAGCNQGSSTVTVSSQNLNASGSSIGNSGNISLTAPQITLLDNSQLLAGANNGKTAGDITLTANSTSLIASATAGITVGKATISGGNVTLAATAESDSYLANATANVTIGSTAGAATIIGNDVTITATATGSANNIASGSSLNNEITNKYFSVPIQATADISNATATVNLNQANIKAAGDLTVTSEAASTTTISVGATTAVSASGNQLGLIYGESNGTSTVSIGTGAVITAGGAATLTAQVDNSLSLSANATDNSKSTAALAFGKATSNSTLQLDGSVTAGNGVTAQSVNNNSFSTQANAADYKASGGGGIGLAISDYQSTATTSVRGTVLATAGDVNITSNSTNSTNSTAAQSQVSDSSDATSQALDKAGLGSFFAGEAAPAAESNSTSLGVTGAMSFASSSNSAATKVTGTVTASTGNVRVTSTAMDVPQLSASGSSSGQSTSVGGALLLGSYSNTAATEVSGNAVLTGNQGVQVTADAEYTSPLPTGSSLLAILTQPYTDAKNIDWSDPMTYPTAFWTEVNDLKSLGKTFSNFMTDPINSGLGLMTVTSLANTSLSGKSGDSTSVGLAGNVDILKLTNRATAVVEGQSKVTAQNGDVAVSGTAGAIMANVSGFPSLPTWNFFGDKGDKGSWGNPGVQAGTALGGSYLGATLANSSTAYIGDGATVTATAGNVNVNAATSTVAVDLVQSGDQAQKFGITGAFGMQNVSDSAQAYIQSNATVKAASDVNVNAANTLDDVAVGGSLSMGGKLAVGVTVDWNTVNQSTIAYIGDPANARTSSCSGCGVTAGGNVNVNAQSSENVIAISFAAAASGSSGQGAGGKGADGESSTQPAGESAPSNSGSGGQGDNGAGGGEYGFGISGNIAINEMGGSSGGAGVTTQAYINNGANVVAGKDIGVGATDSSLVIAVGVAGTVSKTAALAGAYSQNTIVKDIEASTANSNLTGAGLNVNSQITDSTFINVTAGGSVNTQQGIALAGSVSNNAITNTTTATIGDGTVADLGSDGVTIGAAQKGLAVSVAVGVAIAPDGTGVGAAIDIGNYKNTTFAGEGVAQITSDGNVQITATNNETLWPVAVSLAAGNSFGAAGAAAFEQLTNNTQAAVNGTLTTNGNLLVAANDQTSLNIVAGGVGVGGDLGVSISAIIPSVTRTTDATVGGTADVTALGSSASPIFHLGTNVVGTLVEAASGGALNDYAAAGAVAGEGAASGAVIINQFWNTGKSANSLTIDTEATIASGAKVNYNNTGADSAQSVALSAADNTSILDVAGSLGVGMTAGMAVGFDVMVPSWTVASAIRSGATVNAGNNVSVTSALNNKIESYVLSGSASAGGLDPSITLAGAVSSITETSDTSALIDGTVHAGGSVAVVADRNTSKLNTVDGNVSISFSVFGVGVGISSSIVNATDTVDASIGSQGNVIASGQGSALQLPNGQLDASGNPVYAAFQGVSVTAMSNSSVNPIAAGVDGSGVAGAAGSAPITTLTETTTAHVDAGAQVTQLNASGTYGNAGQGVQVLATDNTGLTSFAGSVAVGGGALGAAADVENVTRTVNASVTGASVAAADNIAVGASTLGFISSSAASGAGGGIALAGAISTITETTTTQALIDGGA